MSGTLLNAPRIYHGHLSMAVNLEVTLLYEDFLKAFDSIHRGKMEQILLANGQP